MFQLSGWEPSSLLLDSRGERLSAPLSNCVEIQVFVHHQVSCLCLRQKLFQNLPPVIAGQCSPDGRAQSAADKDQCRHVCTNFILKSKCVGRFDEFVSRKQHDDV